MVVAVLSLVRVVDMVVFGSLEHVSVTRSSSQPASQKNCSVFLSKTPNI